MNERCWCGLAADHLCAHDPLGGAPDDTLDAEGRQRVEAYMREFPRGEDDAINAPDVEAVLAFLVRELQEAKAGAEEHQHLRDAMRRIAIALGYSDDNALVLLATCHEGESPADKVVREVEELATARQSAEAALARLREATAAFLDDDDASSAQVALRRAFGEQPQEQARGVGTVGSQHAAGDRNGSVAVPAPAPSPARTEEPHAPEIGHPDSRCRICGEKAGHGVHNPHARLDALESLVADVRALAVATGRGYIALANDGCESSLVQADALLVRAALAKLGGRTGCPVSLRGP